METLAPKADDVLEPLRPPSDRFNFSFFSFQERKHHAKSSSGALLYLPLRKRTPEGATSSLFIFFSPGWCLLDQAFPLPAPNDTITIFFFPCPHRTI